MKMKSTFKALVALMGACAFTACNNEEFGDNPSPMSISIAKQPEFTIVSGGHTLVQSATTRSGENSDLLYFKKADCPDAFKASFPDQKLYKPECDYVYACIKEDAALIAEGKAPKYEVDKNSFTEENFYIVNAYSSKDHDAKGNHSDVAGDMHDLMLNGVSIKEFNTNTCVAADLIMAPGGLKEVTYFDSFGTKKDFFPVTDWKLFSIPGDEYGWYIGMNYHSDKSGYNDSDYSDWVIKVIPAVKSSDPVDETNGEVEVNLSVNDEHAEGDYIATKTSIHIRALTDVEVFIPVDKKYYCEGDDMDISLSHKYLDIIYNTQPRYVEKQIADKTVTFKVEYKDEGILITTDGMCKEVIDYCDENYYDGVTFEVWNYFKDITRADLKQMLDQAQVTFLDQKPKTYINAFAKVMEYEGRIYSKFNDNEQLVPYTDAECTQPLDSKFWTRETPDSKDYIFIGTANPWDCTVTPSQAGYTAKENEPSATDPNFNVVYTLQ